MPWRLPLRAAESVLSWARIAELSPQTWGFWVEELRGCFELGDLGGVW